MQDPFCWLKSPWLRRASLALLALALLLGAGWLGGATVHAADGPRHLLVFPKTAGFRHASIADGLNAIQQLAATNNLVVEATEDAAAFNEANLARFHAVVFLMTTGDVLDTNQQAAFERYIRAGNGYAGVHSASDTEYSWPWYGGLVGAYFSNHPAIQTATVRVEDTNHVSSSFLPAAWVRNDEWYNFRSNPRGAVQVLARLDESTYTGGTMGDHPIAWYRGYDGGRAWYTAGGHTSASYTEPLFRAHLLGGLRYAAGVPETQPAGQPVSLVPPGSTWKFLDDGSNQGAAWTGTNFNDGAWSAGPAQLGYGDGDEATVLRSNRLDTSRIITTYFRKSFLLSNAWALTNLTVRLLRDDGGIAYLNGVEIFRSNMTNGLVTFTTPAAATVNGADESVFFATNVSPALLRSGTNVLAVEIHQVTTTSSDVSFDLELAGYQFNRPPALAISTAGAQTLLQWPAWAATATVQSASNLAPSAVWMPVTNAIVITNDVRAMALGPTIDGQRFFRLRLP